MENNTPAKKKLPEYVILGIIALVAAVVLAATNMITRGPIQEHAEKALREAFGAVITAESYEAMTVPADHDVSTLAVAKNGDEIVGYCVTASGMGYNGAVAVTLGVDTNGLVTGCVVGDTSFAETPGFGARAKEASFQDQFVGLDAVNGGSFEALSGATITSNAILDAVNKALRCVDAVALQKEPAADPIVTFGAPAEKPAATKAPIAVEGGTKHEGTARGFQSDVKVIVHLDADGVVAGVEIESSNETPGFGTRCAEDTGFIEQFNGKTGPFTLGENVDALSGATVTSTAVVEAVNAALTSPAMADASLTGTAKGFQSDVTVTLTAPNGVIDSIVIASGDETPGFGTRCAEDAAFLEQFIGKSAPLTLGENIDALSGATVTSTAVVEAANAALASAGAAEETVTSITSNEKADLGVKADGAAVVDPVDGYTGTLTVNLTVADGKVTDGSFASEAPAAAPAESAETLTAEVEGFASDVAVTVTLNADGTIATLVIDSANETKGFGTRCAEDEAFINQFIGKAAPFTAGENVDVLAGATVTSKAVIEALNEIVPAAEAAAPAAETLTAEVEGFASDVAVTVTLNADGTIATLVINSANETKGFGTRCAEDEAFINQFIGKAAPFTAGENVDVLAGATVTSKAVIEALNEIVPAAEAAAPAAETLTAEVEGFASDVAVTVTLNADGTIATLVINSANETKGFGTRCAEDEAFINQFIGKAAPFTAGENVDVLAGATVTSKAVIEALNEIVPAAEAAAPAAETLTAEVEGFASDVAVTVTLNADGTIATLVINSANETKGFGTRCAEDEAFINQFIGKAAPFTAGENVDVLAGATVTSKAVIEALNEIVPAAEAAAPAAETLTAEVEGFASDVAVTVTLNADGTIATLVIDSANETKGFGTRCAEDEAFINQFIGKAAPFTAGENVDVLAGATVTSKAVIEALNMALEGK